MTKILNRRYTCPNCGEVYMAMTLMSHYSKLPAPKVDEPRCPNCSMLYREAKEKQESKDQS